MSKLAETLKENTRHIYLDLPYPQLTPAKIQSLLELLGQYRGESRVLARVTKKDEFETVLEFPAELSVVACEPLQSQIDRLFDSKVVRFH